VIWNRGTFFSLLVTAFVGSIFLLMVFETWALFTEKKPITEYFRGFVHDFPGWAFAIAIVVGIVLGHFLWGAGRGLLAPQPRRLGEPKGQHAAS